MTCNSKPGSRARSGRRDSHALIYVLSTFTVVALLIVLYFVRSAQTPPPLSISFTGKISGASYRNPFGEFILTNEGKVSFYWNRGEVEALFDPDITFSAAVDSNLPHGILEAGNSTTFRAVVPHTKDVSFRVLISYRRLPASLDRFRAALPSLPAIDQLWPQRDGWHTFTSQWFRTTADYKSSN